MKKPLVSDWIYEQLRKEFNPTTQKKTNVEILNVFKEAKKMEKENLIQAFQDGKHH